MKYFTKIILLLLIIANIGLGVHAGVVDIPKSGTIENVSINVGNNINIVEDVNNFGFSILRILKVILQGILVIYIVYIGITMIISMGTDEDKLTKSKNQLWYSLVALVFINIPGTIYDAINLDSNKTISLSTGNFTSSNLNGSLLLSSHVGFMFVIDQVIIFLELFIGVLALYAIIMAGINMMTSRGRDEKITEAKNKIFYSIAALIFVGFMELWRQFAITGKFDLLTDSSEGAFSQGVNLLLVFAGPVAIFFLSLAGYYYITSNGEEEQTKKAKNIITNTLLAVLLLAVMVTFLNDLINF